MKRIDFIKRSAVAGLSFSFFGKTSAAVTSCVPTADETEGPFPTHKSADLVMQNIRGDREGVPLIIRIGLFNINTKCSALKDAVIDIWHCDSKGEYSEYGGKDEHGHEMREGDSMRMPPAGTPPPGFKNDNGPHMPPPMGGASMQAADHKKEHFLRGRQTTDKNGQVMFQSVYPGWYPSRAPHIHVHIFDAAGKSLLVTQIALPEEISKTVYNQGVYAPHGHPDTSNTSDMVFNDSIANEMATVTGNSKDGYILQHSIYVKA